MVKISTAGKRRTAMLTMSTGGRTPPINLSFDMFFVSVSQGHFGLYWSLFLTNISLPNWIVATVDQGWMKD